MAGIFANIEWIGALCSFLSLTCAIQLIITGILALSIPEVLLLTGSHLATAAGLMAGFVALPTALRLKTAQTSPNMDRIYGYTLCYQRLAVCVSGALHFLALILVVCALITTTNLCRDFKKLMVSYHTKTSSKVLVDNIQFVLQCCGGHDYKDWFEINWGGYEYVGGMKRKKHSIEQLLHEDTDAYPDLALIRNDAVPFSCCSKTSLTSCVTQNLIQLGTNTINNCGCGKMLHFAVNTLLWFEFVIYATCLGLEIVILILLRKSPISNKSRAPAQTVKYGEFSNISERPKRSSMRSPVSSKSSRIPLK